MSIIQNGNIFSVVSFQAQYEKLPKGIYILNYDENRGFHLSKKDELPQPKKLYGDHSITKRWMTSWNNCEKNMGIILSGTKGTGKTVTAQKFCIESGLPVILITQAWSGPAFINFITSPDLGEFICFIDEFEKIYNENNREDQGSAIDLMSMMDGNYNTKIIFLLTVNTFRINEYLINRLNRIKYKKEYGDYLDADVVDSVIADLLNDKKYTESIHKFFDRIGILTFDLLVNIIKEINIFDQDAMECGKHLNLKAEDRYYEVHEVYGGLKYQCDGVSFNLHDTDVDIRRKSTNYLPIPKDEEGTPMPHWIEYDINLELSECVIEKVDGSRIFTITDNEDGLKFEFKASSKLQFLF